MRQLIAHRDVRGLAASRRPRWRRPGSRQADPLDHRRQRRRPAGRASDVSDHSASRRTRRPKRSTCNIRSKTLGLGSMAGPAIRVWKQLGVGVAVSVTSRAAATAEVTASIPHPFFFNQPRTVTGTRERRHAQRDRRASSSCCISCPRQVELRLRARRRSVVASASSRTSSPTSPSPNPIRSTRRRSRGAITKIDEGVGGRLQRRRGRDVDVRRSGRGRRPRAFHARPRRSRGRATDADADDRGRRACRQAAGFASYSESVNCAHADPEFAHRACSQVVRRIPSGPASPPTATSPRRRAGRAPRARSATSCATAGARRPLPPRHRGRRQARRLRRQPGDEARPAPRRGPLGRQIEHPQFRQTPSAAGP